ncbi:MAG: hypothetical protein ABJG88_06230 [Litorimonas sp.]
MSHVKKSTIKVGVLALALWGGYSWVNQTPDRAENLISHAKYVAEVTEEKTEAAFEKTNEWASENAEVASNAWDSVGLESSVDNLQDRAKPYRRSVINAARPVTTPVAKIGRWVDSKISLIGVLFILLTGSTVVIMSASLLDNKEYG